MDEQDLVKLIKLRRLLHSGGAKTTRVTAGLSRNTMSAALEISWITLYRWEKGESFPHSTKLALRYYDLLQDLMAA